MPSLKSAFTGLIVKPKVVNRVSANRGNLSFIINIKNFIKLKQQYTRIDIDIYLNAINYSMLII
tara:strand:+ start:1355 stop:1546 length:192 start_codon:yes stop_codon:yes gene_type:complete